MEISTNQLLRFTTAGNVDDGKSTLIGRLLYDSKSIFEDQMQAVTNTSKRRGVDGIDLALFTDGLKDEREQGITIDVAYRYFTTPKRKFIIADTPGHIQYTRNMVTGASTANAAIVLIDARKGVTEQTKRHSFISSLLHIPHLIVCVNKMDLVDYSEEIYNRIIQEFEELASKLVIKDIRFIPISALNGDNVVNRSVHMDWFSGSPLLDTLENLHISSDYNKTDARFPIQTVIRPQSEAFHDYRGYAGRLMSGILRPGDEITVLPSGLHSRIKTIHLYDKEITEAFAPMSIALTIDDNLDIGRGDMLVRRNNQPEISQQIDAMLCWFNTSPARIGGKYSIHHTTKTTKAMIQTVVYTMDMNSLERVSDLDTIEMNAICRVRLKTATPLFIDTYRDNRHTGNFILVDDTTNETVAAGMII